MQRVSGGLSALISHLSELEKWDAVLLQENSFTDESLNFEALEASLGGHKLVLNSSCPWDNAIVIHSPVEGFPSLVCILVSLGVGWSPSCRGIHFLLYSSAELGG